MNFLWDALQTAGNILDTPGSVARGLLAGDPGRAFGGIFDPQQRVGGREMLESWGVLGPNQSGLDWGDVGGFVAEQVTDPLAWVGGRAAAGLLRETGGNLANPTSLTRALGIAPQTGVYHPLEVAEAYGKEVPFLTPSLAADLSESWIGRLTPQERAAVKYYTQEVGDTTLPKFAIENQFAPGVNYWDLNRALQAAPFSPTMTPDFEKAFFANIIDPSRDRRFYQHLDKDIDLRFALSSAPYLNWLKEFDSAISKAPTLDEEIQLLRGANHFANLKMPRNESFLPSDIEAAYGLRTVADEEPLVLSANPQVSAPTIEPISGEMVNELDWYRRTFLPRETVEKSFLSTSWHPTRNYLDKPRGHVNLIVKPGTPIAIPGPLGWAGESEAVLPRNALIEVLDVKPTGTSLGDFYEWFVTRPGSYITHDDVPWRPSVDPDSASVLALIQGLAR